MVHIIDLLHISHNVLSDMLDIGFGSALELGGAELILIGLFLILNVIVRGMVARYVASLSQEASAWIQSGTITYSDLPLLVYFFGLGLDKVVVERAGLLGSKVVESWLVVLNWEK